MNKRFIALLVSSVLVATAPLMSRGFYQTPEAAVRAAKYKEPKVTDSYIDNYLKGSVVGGNSVTMGYCRYVHHKSKKCMGNPICLAVGSYSLTNDAARVTKRSLHPTYKGVKRKLIDHVKTIKPKYFFINFGANDLNVLGTPTAIDWYQDFLKRVHKAVPDTRIYILSATPLLHSKRRLTNKNLKTLNKAMKAYADKVDGIEYIDLFYPLFDKKTGKLKRSYCSDGFLHLSSSGNERWEKAIRAVVRVDIKNEKAAQDAVKTVQKSHLKADYKKAEEKCSKVDGGKSKDTFLNQLKEVKKKGLKENNDSKK